MLFDCGIGNATMKCAGCGKPHHLVSVGEETLICACGDALAFKSEENYYDYFWIRRRFCSKTIGYALNIDPRNLC